MSIIQGGETKESKNDALKFPKQWDQNLQTVTEAQISFSNCDAVSKLPLPEYNNIVKTRIGSPSQFAKIYKIYMNSSGTKSICAVKVALFVDNNRELFRKEHDIATKLFAAFPKSFLRVFKYTEVENIVFSDMNTMLEAKKNVYEQSAAWKNTLSQLKNRPDKTLWLNAKRTGPETPRYISTRVPGGLLYSQLGVGDLKQCIQSNAFPEEMLMQFKENVIEAIQKMHSQGVVHNDLHLGNVLVVWIDNGLQAVIHDFDKSDYSIDEDKRKNDMKTFLSHFEEEMEFRGKRNLRF